VHVFDGRGSEVSARVESLGERVRLTIIESVESAAELRVNLTLAQAVLKGDKMEDIVRDATMLGVAVVQPFFSAHVDVPRAAWSERRLERLRRVAVSSTKQCGRAVVPEVAAPISFDAVVDLIGAVQKRRAPPLPDLPAGGGCDDCQCVILVEPARGSGSSLAALRDTRRPARAVLAIGPEGGWTREEVQRAQSTGFLPLTLGRRTVRADAMPVVALAALLAIWEEF
jgi:16S rRNA (uracil1498-N3)-methyltransferase